ncbi:hypothetical protein CAPTEDRAFT_203120 [Capitella teleta]|uniref:Sulfatase N-terminal domain-containing protein n=1 Tax=Capitella teleta TaxID=283909 RepID=R7V9Z2_CAPTE|nr:hypothetical protein CAPTEDRAFT_203120 [Capitella teleta]|eukprot:ELU15332.1 hypothetical protein CAPTEDRAFT_203120 [Capitella teleta]
MEINAMIDAFQNRVISYITLRWNMTNGARGELQSERNAMATRTRILLLGYSLCSVRLGGLQPSQQQLMASRSTTREGNLEEHRRDCDAETGEEIMKKLESSGFKKHTIIVFAADHGIHLGENEFWEKFTNFEVSARISLIFKIPGLTKPHSKSRNFVELVDIFPTLIEAAQLPPAPMCPRDSNGWAFCTEGVGLLPLLTCQQNIPWKNRVFWQGRWECDNAKYIAYTVRTDDYRYTENIERTHGAPKHWPSQVFCVRAVSQCRRPRGKLQRLSTQELC